MVLLAKLKGWSTLALLSLALSLAPSGLAKADPTAGASVDAGAEGGSKKDRSSPAQLRHRPSLRSTGRVGDVDLPPSAINISRPNIGNEPEKPAPAAPARRATAVVAPPSADAAALMDAKWPQQRAELDNCRVETARKFNVAPDDVAVVPLRLRWIVRPNGTVFRVQARPVTPRTSSVTAMDRALVSCIRRRIVRWRFVGMPDRPFQAERTL